MYDSTLETLQTSGGPYSITLTLSPSGTFSGTLTGDTTNGQKEFSGLQVASSGTYTITASSDNLNSATTSEFTVESLALKTIFTSVRYI